MGLKSIAEKAKSTYSIVGLVIIFAGGTFYYTKNEVISLIAGVLVVFGLAVLYLYDRVSKIENGLQKEK